MKNVTKITNNGSSNRHFTDIYKLSSAISKGLSLQNRRMSSDEAIDAAEHLINFFGYNDRVIDNMLEPEDRDAFYTMEDISKMSVGRAIICNFSNVLHKTPFSDLY